jgi:hypothetical protein
MHVCAILVGASTVIEETELLSVSDCERLRGSRCKVRGECGSSLEVRSCIAHSVHLDQKCAVPVNCWLREGVFRRTCRGSEREWHGGVAVVVVVCARYKRVCFDVRALVDAVSVNGVAAAAVVHMRARMSCRKAVVVRAEEQNVLETGNSKRWIESDDMLVRIGSV